MILLSLSNSRNRTALNKMADEATHLPTAVYGMRSFDRSLSFEKVRSRSAFCFCSAADLLLFHASPAVLEIGKL